MIMSFGKRAVLALGLAVAMAAPGAAMAQNPAYPPGIHADSGNRLPLVKRDSLDPTGQKTYDQLSSPSGGSLAGLRGPGGIMLYAPKVSELNSALNRYLRSSETGFDGHVRELAILVTAREFNSQFEWAAHESVAVKEGVSAGDGKASRRIQRTRTQSPSSVVVMVARVFSPMPSEISPLCRKSACDKSIRLSNISAVP
jgi:hypothetical protein